MQWFKFHADFATDSRVQRLSEIDRCRLVQLMCLQCSEQFFDLESAAFTMRISHDDLCDTVARLHKSGLVDELGQVTMWTDRNVPLTDAERQANRRREARRDKGFLIEGGAFGIMGTVEYLTVLANGGFARAVRKQKYRHASY